MAACRGVFPKLPIPTTSDQAINVQRFLKSRQHPGVANIGAAKNLCAEIS